MFDREHRIALHRMQGNQASSHGAGEVSWVFSSYGMKLGYILELRRGWPLETQVCSATSGLLSSYDGHLKNLNYAWQDKRTLLEVRRETKLHFLVGTVILGFLSIFKKGQSSSPLEALNSCASRGVKGM